MLSAKGIWNKYSYEVCYNYYDTCNSYMFEDAVPNIFLLSFRYISAEDAEQQ